MQGPCSTPHDIQLDLYVTPAYELSSRPSIHRRVTNLIPHTVHRSSLPSARLCVEASLVTTKGEYLFVHCAYICLASRMCHATQFVSLNSTISHLFKPNLPFTEQAGLHQVLTGKVDCTPVYKHIYKKKKKRNVKGKLQKFLINFTFMRLKATF